MQRRLLYLLLLASTSCARVQARPASDFATIDAPVVALTGVRVIDGTGQPGRAAQTIVIKDGKIAEVGPTREVRVPANARVLDLNGRTVIPGYVMVHEHLFGTPDNANPTSMPHTFAPLYLAGGATTIRTGGSIDWSADRAAKQAIDRGEMAGPDIDLTSPYFNGPALSWLAFQSPTDRGRTLVAKFADQGATSFKAYTGLTRDELTSMIAEAHRRGLKVTGHLCAVTYAEAAEAGIDNLEHGLWAATDFVENKPSGECPQSSDALGAMLRAEWNGVLRLIQTLVARRVAVTSTLAVFEGFVATRQPSSSDAVALMAPKARARYEQHRADMAANPLPVWLEVLEREMRFERAFVRAGGLLIAGTDPTGHGGLVAGFSNQKAIQLLVEAGFTVPEAIQIGTSNGARYLGRDDRIGTIAAGKQADLVVLRGDPEDRQSALESVETVFKKGIGYDANALKDSMRGRVFAQ